MPLYKIYLFKSTKYVVEFITLVLCKKPCTVCKITIVDWNNWLIFFSTYRRRLLWKTCSTVYLRRVSRLRIIITEKDGFNRDMHVISRFYYNTDNINNSNNNEKTKAPPWKRSASFLTPNTTANSPNRVSRLEITKFSLFSLKPCRGYRDGYFCEQPKNKTNVH